MLYRRSVEKRRGIKEPITLRSYTKTAVMMILLSTVAGSRVLPTEAKVSEALIPEEVIVQSMDDFAKAVNNVLVVDQPEPDLLEEPVEESFNLETLESEENLALDEVRKGLEGLQTVEEKIDHLRLLTTDSFIKTTALKEKIKNFSTKDVQKKKLVDELRDLNEFVKAINILAFELLEIAGENQEDEQSIDEILGVTDELDQNNATFIVRGDISFGTIDLEAKRKVLDQYIDSLFTVDGAYRDLFNELSYIYRQGNFSLQWKIQSRKLLGSILDKMRPHYDNIDTENQAFWTYTEYDEEQSVIKLALDSWYEYKDLYDNLG